MHSSFEILPFRLRFLQVALLAAVVAGSLSAVAEQVLTVSGSVTDPSGAIVADAVLTAINTKSSTRLQTTSDDQGRYQLALPAGTYELHLDLSGFEPFDTVITISNEPLQLDILLSLASRSDSINVEENPAMVDTSLTETGAILSAKQLAAAPINGRSFTDVLAMQPGIVPASTAQPNAVVMSGCTNTPPSGDLNAGNVSVSGQRETANGFSVNGSIVEEDFNNGTAIVPELDSISELNVLTGNFNAEYGNFSGGQIAVTTKSGTNQLHGSGFEFLRNTNLDARDYFATQRYLRPQPVRRHPRRTDSKGPRVLLLRLPGHADDARAGDGQHRRPKPGRSVPCDCA